MGLTDGYGTFLNSEGIVYMDESFIDRLHDIVLDAHGGLKGKLQDNLGSICSNAFYHKDNSLEGVAAYYLSRIVKGHPFCDGNKRTGFLTSVVFLGTNSRKYNIYDEKLTAGKISEIANSLDMDQAYEYSKLFVDEHIANPVQGGYKNHAEEKSINDVTYILSGI